MVSLSETQVALMQWREKIGAMYAQKTQEGQFVECFYPDDRLKRVWSTRDRILKLPEHLNFFSDDGILTQLIQDVIVNESHPLGLKEATLKDFVVRTCADDYDYTFRFLIEKFSYLVSDSKMATYLMMTAVKNDSQAVLKYLLEKQSDDSPFRSRNMDSNLLSLAISYRHFHLVSRLLDAGFDMYQDHGFAFSVLSHHVSKDTIDAFMSRGFDLNRVVGLNDETVFMQALKTQVCPREETMMYLLSSFPVNIHYVDKQGLSPLLSASRAGLLNFFKKLVEMGANIHPDGNQMLKLIIEKGRVHVNRINARGYHIFHELLMLKRWDQALLLMTPELDVQFKDADLHTALMRVIIAGPPTLLCRTQVPSLPLQIMQKLVQAGCPLDARNRQGMNAIDIAKSLNKDASYIEFLTESSHQREQELTFSELTARKKSRYC